ncbi:hypothetical protein [Planctomycetes bacterium TBK1r]|uniref:Phage-related minor tail protein n=1 Tax=Stieleria magnilauensis TaxID=2527963 RepID=A0ABX5XZD2_9BACT|nr:hypothetical protein TBK1r_64340 [Planctomycetes bacterium TBK1r]
MSENTIVKLDGDEKGLVQAFNKSEQAQQKLTKSIGAFGADAKRAAAQAVGAVGEVQGEVVNLDKAVAVAGKNLAGMPKSVRDAFKGLVKDTGLAKSEFEKIDATIDQLRQTTDLTEAQLERMRQKLKKAADAASMSKAAKENKRSVSAMVRNIGQLGPEAQKAVSAANADLAKLGAGAQSLDDMLRKMRRIGPEGKRQAEALERSFKVSLDKVETEFKGPLDDIRKLGPAGNKAADEIKRELVTAGHVSEQAMSRIMKPLTGLGSKVAATAAKAQASFTTAASKSTKAWGAFAAKMTATLGGVAAVTGTVRIAVDEVNKALERQAALRAAAKDANTDLATVQATALQNLTGLSPEVQKDLIDTAPRRIANDTGTGIVGAKELAEAAGVVMSSGVSRPEVIKEVMSASADIMQLSPESISEFAKAVAGAMKASGQQDDANAVRNVASGVIAGMKGSGVTDLGQFSATAPRALASGALASDGGSMAEAIGAFDALAIAGAASQKTGDDKGDRSSTFASQIVGKLDEYFDSKVIEQNARPNLIKSKQTDLKTAQAAGDSEEVTRLKADIADLRAKNRINFTKAPGTPLARLQAIHRYQLQDDFKASAGAFGDATFKGVIDDLLRGGSVFQDVMRTRQDITGQLKGASAGSYAANLIVQQESLQPTTPMNIKKASAAGESAGELATLDATGKAVSQASLDIVKQAVRATEDTVGESVNLLATGYRPNPVMEWMGFGGSIERDGFGGGDLKSVVRAQDFLQGQERSYYTKKVETTDGAETLGVRSTQIVDRDVSEIPQNDLREANAFRQAAAANEKLLADLSVFPRSEIESAIREFKAIRRDQEATFNRDGNLSPIENEILAKNNALLEQMLSVLNRNADAAEATADATAVTAGNTAPRDEFDPNGAQRAANAVR